MNLSMLNNRPYSLLVYVSYFISRSINARFTSVTFIVHKWHWWCKFFNLLAIFNVFTEAIKLADKVVHRHTIHFKVLEFCVMQRVSFMHEFICREPPVCT